MTVITVAKLRNEFIIYRQVSEAHLPEQHYNKAGEK